MRPGQQPASTSAHLEEHARDRLHQLRRLRWGILVSTAAAVSALPVLAFPGMPGDKWVAVVGAALGVAGSVVKWAAVNSTYDTPNRQTGVGSLVMACGAMFLEAYFGLGSAVAALIALGLLVHAMDDASQWPRFVAGFVCVTHLALATLCEFTDLPIHRVDWHGHDSTALVRGLLHLGIASTYLMAHLFGRRLLHETSVARAGLSAAAHAVALGEALLAEARAELDAARSEGRGRFTGRRMGRFVVETLLGHGGMGEVYVARDDAGTRVALKVLRFGHGSLNARTLARFEQESRIVSSIDSPFLVPVVEVSAATAEFPYIAMELLNGTDLERYLVRHGELPLDEVMPMVDAVAHGLDAAHRCGVVHRDLKPANIFRTSVDGGVSWRVLDFGIALLRRANVRITSEEQVGTVGYMAPEQQLQDAKVDQRADVYALAVVTLECLTLFNPVVTSLDQRLGGWSPDAMARRDDALSDVPSEVAHVLRAALSEEPEGRFSSCLDFLNALRLASTAGASDAPFDARRHTEASEFEAMPTVATPIRR